MAGESRTLSYQYDLEGNRTRINHPGGVYFTYNRDGLNRVCTLGESAAAETCGTETPVFLAMRYSNEGRRDRIFRPSGSVTRYDTDNALRLDAFTQDFAGASNNTNDLTNGFDYNPASQITSLTQSNLQYNYTEADNRVGAYGVDGLNRYTAIDGVPTSYDVNGNLTADGTGMTYTYDMENRLVATGGVASALTYDVLGRLARVSVAGTTTDFHYDGDALVGEYVAGSLTRRYVHSGGVDEPLVQYNGASIGASHRRYLYADHQGSVIAHSDNAGAVTQKNAYDPYGIPKSSNDGRFGYTGQTWISQLGLNYYKARIYAPKIGRFLQTDPIFYEGGMNVYAYVGGDPVLGRDPTGKNKERCPWCEVVQQVNAAIKAAQAAAAASVSRAEHNIDNGPANKRAQNLAEGMANEKAQKSLGKASDALTYGTAAAQAASGDLRGAATTIGGDLIDKAIGAAVGGSISVVASPAVGAPIGIGVEAVSGYFGAGEALAGPTVDAMANAASELGNSIESSVNDAGLQVGKYMEGIEKDLSNLRCGGNPECLQP